MMLIITNVINEQNWAFQIKLQLNYLRLTNLCVNQDSIYINYEHVIDPILTLFGRKVDHMLCTPRTNVLYIASS